MNNTMLLICFIILALTGMIGAILFLIRWFGSSDYVEAGTAKGFTIFAMFFIMLGMFGIAGVRNNDISMIRDFKTYHIKESVYGKESAFTYGQGQVALRPFSVVSLDEEAKQSYVTTNYVKFYWYENEVVNSVNLCQKDYEAFKEETKQYENDTEEKHRSFWWPWFIVYAVVIYVLYSRSKDNKKIPE